MQQRRRRTARRWLRAVALAGAGVGAGVGGSGAGALLAGGGATAWAERAPRRVGIDDVVELALHHNPQLLAARARSRGARDVVRSARGRFLSPVRLSDEYQHWDSPYALSFPIPVPGKNGGPPTFPSLVARDQDTNTFVVAGSQPIVGLLRIGEEHAAQGENAEAALAQVRAAEAQVREAVKGEYLRYFEARALQEIARASEQQLGEQVTIADARLKAGVLTRADLLRLQVAVANGKQQEIQAQAEEQVSRANLLAIMGVDEDPAGLEFAEPSSLLVRGAGTTDPGYDVSYQSALARRPELVVAERQASAARHDERSRTLALLPEVNLEAAYLRTDGQAFAPKDSAYVGFKAQWAVWEWGASWYLKRAAEAQAEAAAHLAEDQRRQIGRELVTRRARSQAATSAVDVAEAAIASAEEAYRVTDALLRAGSATTTDLLDAQAALTQARLNRVRAQYEQAIARVSLERALGQ